MCGAQSRTRHQRLYFLDESILQHFLQSGGDSRVQHGTRISNQCNLQEFFLFTFGRITRLPLRQRFSTQAINLQRALNSLTVMRIDSRRRQRIDFAQ